VGRLGLFSLSAGPFIAFWRVAVYNSDFFAAQSISGGGFLTVAAEFISASGRSGGGTALPLPFHFILQESDVLKTHK